MNAMDGSLEAQLEACLARMADGATLEECLADYPEHRSALSPLLQAALELSMAAPSLPTAAQIDRMHLKVLAGVKPAPKLTRQPNRPILRWGLLAASLLLVLAAIWQLVGLADGDNHSAQGEADLPTATQTVGATTIKTNVPTIIAQAPSNTATHTDVPTHTPSPRPSDTLRPSDTTTWTATVQASDTAQPTYTSPPPFTATATLAPAALSDESELAVFVDITGTVSGTEVGGVTIVEQNAGDFAFAEGEVVTVSGMLLDDGRVLVDMARRATSEEQTNAVQCPTESPDCDPILVILSEALGVEYAELAALKGLGDGEIARIYLLAQAGAGDVATLIEQRETGASWRDLMVDETDPINLGNGKGQTMREQAAVQHGNSENAPGQANHPTPHSSGNSGNNSNGNNGNNGNGNGNNGNNGNNNGNGNGKNQ